MRGALDGLLVVSLEQAVAAPFCTMRLADAGARVIKIERAEGDFARGYDHVAHGESSYFVWLNRGKESLVADMKDAGDAALVRRIVAQADVFVQNLAPGAAQRLGFGSADLRAAHPRLVTCDISGYGEAGPYRDMKAYDLLIQCEAGLAEITGTPDAPGRVGVSAADICCGMNAHAGVLEALLAREVTGRGSGIAVSLFDGLADWMTVPLLHQDYGGRAPKRVGINHASIAPYGAYATGDGRQTVLAVQNEREWAAFCAHVLQQPGLAHDPRFASNAQRCAHREALQVAIEGVLADLDSENLARRLNAAKIAFGRLNDVAGLSRHPQLRRIEVATPGGPVAMPASPIQVEDGRPTPPRPVPATGAHDAAIRKEFA
ncbi:CoA transferase [Sphingomonas sp. CGMCC 1.13654]|uniref:CoA transferase n=1 Tax=Sphingomonas chungangi TaxID=2683589 RepID=A0A838L9M7_9SPHN|nr:CaiB/BaiF CoA-transferase family protein [Sphingomonas chungangi]MBA2934826.1 CoA transferase [Sphingomonas chungangi]MVW58137.1 CoA transferase [Sphingomonas chungangi]